MFNSNGWKVLDEYLEQLENILKDTLVYNPPDGNVTQRDHIIKGKIMMAQTLRVEIPEAVRAAVKKENEQTQEGKK